MRKSDLTRWYVITCPSIVSSQPSFKPQARVVWWSQAIDGGGVGWGEALDSQRRLLITGKKCVVSSWKATLKISLPASLRELMRKVGWRQTPFVSNKIPLQGARTDSSRSQCPSPKGGGELMPSEHVTAVTWRTQQSQTMQNCITGPHSISFKTRDKRKITPTRTKLKFVCPVRKCFIQKPYIPITSAW